ncbi:MAG: GNAT family N-acetyltransferase [Rhizobiaceae bacterium]|nr:GNAT family N-acetyltransferase [Rhizobiaceae bacterium]
MRRRNARPLLLPEPISIVRPPELIRTSRLVLRRPVAADAEALFAAYASHIETVRYLTWTPHRDVADTVASLRQRDEEWREGSSFPFVIAPAAAPDSPFGSIHLRPKGHAVSFGYVLGRSQWARGYATEALTCLVDWSLSQPGVHRACASCDADNPASGRVMEKAGMQYEGTLRRFVVHPNMSGEPRDAMMYARFRS